MDVLVNIGNFFYEAKILIWVLFGLISLIGSIDKFFPSFFPNGIKFLNNVKKSSENSFFLFLLSFLEFLFVSIWKLSNALFKLFFATLRLVIAFIRKTIGPYIISAIRKMEKGTEKVDKASNIMEKKSKKMEEASIRMHKDKIL